MVETIPLDYLLVETNAPFLTPEPFRGKRNIPPYVEYTAAKVAEIKGVSRSEEHTSELQSRENLVCRLLLEKKKKVECHCKIGRAHV